MNKRFSHHIRAGFFALHPIRRNARRDFPHDYKTEKAKIIERQARLYRFSREVLERTSVWRKAITANFPNDPRNLRAPKTLDQLAVNVANLTDEQWSI